MLEEINEGNFLQVTRRAKFTHLEVWIDAIKTLGVFRQLFPDIFRTDEDTLQMGPRPLYLKEDTDDRVRSG